MSPWLNFNLRLLLGVLDAVTAFVFGFVESFVGLGQEIRERWRFGAAESGYAYACGYGKRLVIEGEFLRFHLLADSFEGDDAVVAFYVGDNFQKFFSALASTDVRLTGIAF